MYYSKKYCIIIARAATDIAHAPADNEISASFMYQKRNHLVLYNATFLH